jgi:hypothetical protein
MPDVATASLAHRAVQRDAVPERPAEVNMSITRSRTGLWLSAGVLTMAAALSACGGGGDDGATAAPATDAPAQTTVAPAEPVNEDEPAGASGEQTYVGAIEGTEAQIAVTVDGSKVLAFFCDSEKTWGLLEGTASGSAVTATEPGGNTLAGDLDGDELSGTVSINGEPHQFTATAQSGDAGSYFLETKQGDQVTYTGWVRSADGEVDGARFTIDLGVLSRLPEFSASEKKVIQQIFDTGVVAGPPGQPGIPADAVPLSLSSSDPSTPTLGGAVRCGIAGFKFKRAQNALNANENQATNDAFYEAGRNFEKACKVNFPTI